jgi:hypothetical protein
VWTVQSRVRIMCDTWSGEIGTKNNGSRLLRSAGGSVSKLVSVIQIAPVMRYELPRRDPFCPLRVYIFITEYCGFLVYAYHQEYDSDALHSSQIHSLKWYPLKRYKQWYRKVQHHSVSPLHPFGEVL